MDATRLQDLQRAARHSSAWWLVQMAGAVSALLAPPLLVLLGLIVYLLERGGHNSAPREWPLHALVEWIDRTWQGHSLVCLAWLTLVGLVLALALAASLAVLYRAVQAFALAVAVNVKERLYRQASNLGAADVLGRHQAQVDQLFTTGVERVRRGVVDRARALPRAIVSLVALFLLALACDVWITLACALFAVVAWRMHRALRERARRAARKSDIAAQHAQQQLLDSLRQAPLVASYSLSEPPGESLSSMLANYRKHAAPAAASDTLSGPALLAFILSGVALLVFILGSNVPTNPPRLSLAGVVVLGASLLCAYFPAARLARLRKQLAQAEEAAAEICDYLSREPAVSPAPGAVAKVTLRQQLALEGVTLADRQGQKLLGGVSIVIPARQKLAILASDARSPQALAALLVRFLDPAAGRITSDGCDIRLANLQPLRSTFLYVAAGGELFTGTVAANLACGDTRFSAERLAEAIELVGLQDWLRSLPQGLETMIGDQALAVAALPAFQLGLARAALRAPALLVMAEPELELTEAEQVRLEEAYNRLAAQRTVVVLPNRSATLRWVDRLLLIHGGALVADGSHAELLLASELYRHLVYVRFNPFRHVAE